MGLGLGRPGTETWKEKELGLLEGVGWGGVSGVEEEGNMVKSHILLSSFF